MHEYNSYSLEYTNHTIMLEYLLLSYWMSADRRVQYRDNEKRWNFFYLNESINVIMIHIHVIIFMFWNIFYSVFRNYSNWIIH